MSIQQITSSVPKVDVDGLGGHFNVNEILSAGQTVLNQASAAQTAGGNSADLDVHQYSEICFDATISAVSGSSPTMTMFVDRKGVDGNYYQVYTSGAKTANGTVTTTIGTGAATNSGFGNTIRLRWTMGGTNPSFTFSVSITGK